MVLASQSKDNLVSSLQDRSRVPMLDRTNSVPHRKLSVEGVYNL